MTDNEIIKELEKALKVAEEIIYRQKAEKEALIAGQETLHKYIVEQKTEIERLQKKQDLFADIGKMHSEIKTEAIKEFSERLKQKAFAIHKSVDENYLYEIDNSFIDNLVKETMGEADA